MCFLCRDTLTWAVNSRQHKYRLVLHLEVYNNNLQFLSSFSTHVLSFFFALGRMVSDQVGQDTQGEAG